MRWFDLRHNAGHKSLMLLLVAFEVSDADCA
jgi:hypothetical protein